jgi:hypothetical protein
VIPESVEAWGLWYAWHGIPIVPLQAGKAGKYARLPNWNNLATTDAATVDGWCQNLKVVGWQACLKGVTVVDLDIKNNPTVLQDFPRWLDEHGDDSAVLKEIPTSRTPSGGIHYWFVGDLPKTTDRVRGVDVVQIPNLPGTPGYEWINTPGEFEPGDMPKWVSEVLSGAGQADSGASEGRNESLKDWAISRAHQGVAWSQLVKEGLAINQQFDPPMSEDEAMIVLRSSFRYGDDPEPTPEPDNDGVFTTDEFRDMDAPVPPRILGPIRKGTENWMVAAPGSGKTFFAHALAGAAAGGLMMGPWMSSHKHKVTVVDGEMPNWGLKSVITTLKSGGAYRIIASCMQKTPINMLHPDWQDWMYSKVRGQDLVIFDNAVTLFMPSKDLPSASAEYAMAILKYLNLLRNEGIATLTLDHPGKDQKTSFGSSRQHVTADTVGLMDRTHSSVDSEAAGFHLHFSKTRGGWDSNIHGEQTWKLVDGWWRTV